MSTYIIHYTTRNIDGIRTLSIQAQNVEEAMDKFQDNYNKNKARKIFRVETITGNIVYEDLKNE